MKKNEAISILATSVRPREQKDIARYDEAVKMAIDALNEPERKTGKWVGIKEYCDHLNEEAEREGKGNRYIPSGMNIHVYCNQCWEPNDRRTTYCPNCSARMVQEGEYNDS